MWRHLGRIDRDRGVLRADADTHDKAGREQTLPGLRETGADRRCGQTGGREEDLAAAAEVVVEGVDDERATVDLVSMSCIWTSFSGGV